ncbi:Uncharacterized protein F383_26690 [Gossypium arboreum]|uniref:Uncharacterized protein n=7 Tax=Gossypium TaxID=3633 RepID=A0A0B0PBH7_GOSAR|nr:transmembrane protein 230 [Gossypium hirsutum]XP_017627970.1 uncharacterized protein LOC108470948 [Gossypium arboreum]XP_017627971.1 uncharacterized protein LOC108470948 [Gossypium arboreum]KAB2056048.1 hypothetical protein ES319_A11G077800v1 [Gossypium barbadense]TYG93075.1 hypothetical protein ES288_A11G081900v1 [Gossypium darwinii]TYH99675.1 hypothetical protein ES332_A11G082100v1 [Gossypium tomentosum]TYJ08515.1 hypothetical protein E1A91_A11G080100v1 [Gossypium mustelinum]KAG4173628.
MSSRRHVRYSPLAVDEDDDYHGGRRFDPRFDYSPKAFDRVPWKSIVLAVFLLCLGCLLLFLSFFIFSGHMGGEKSQAYGLLVLGILTFLPGFYETRIAYYSWRGAEGYSFASIPDY